jgi:class 3 adenylate cyclase
VAALIARPLDHLGDHALRGLAAPVSIFSPCEAAAPE